MKMERRMAVLFLLALALIVWQALRTEPAAAPPFEWVTKAGERISPMAVPPWKPAVELPREAGMRLAVLEERSVAWPGSAGSLSADGCGVSVRISSQHWARRAATPSRVARWLASSGGREPTFLSAADFLDDDDGDGDPLDDGELRSAGPGAEVEIACGATP
jgi:hypothetical protein